jgi:serine/threonine protein kinase
VHRDFTPDNLILRKDGALKLIDFNVAQQSDASSALSSVVGKPNYLSPEQFRGSPVPQSDIYALGACLQFLLTGEDPVAILSSNPSQTRDDISEQLSNIVQKATEPELSHRFLTASEILAQLNDATASQISLPSEE